MDKNELRNACSFFQLFEKEVASCPSNYGNLINDIIRSILPDNINLLVKDNIEHDKK